MCLNSTNVLVWPHSECLQLIVNNGNFYKEQWHHTGLTHNLITVLINGYIQSYENVLNKTDSISVINDRQCKTTDSVQIIHSLCRYFHWRPCFIELIFCCKRWICVNAWNCNVTVRYDQRYRFNAVPIPQTKLKVF